MFSKTNNYVTIKLIDKSFYIYLWLTLQLSIVKDWKFSNDLSYGFTSGKAKQDLLKSIKTAYITYLIQIIINEIRRHLDINLYIPCRLRPEYCLPLL